MLTFCRADVHEAQLNVVLGSVHFMVGIVVFWGCMILVEMLNCRNVLLWGILDGNRVSCWEGEDCVYGLWIWG